MVSISFKDIKWFQMVSKILNGFKDIKWFQLVSKILSGFKWFQRY